MRSTIFNYLKGAEPEMVRAGADYASALRSAAGNAGWKQAEGVARDNLAGKYLSGSPALDRAMAANRASAMAEAANATARIRSQYGKSGMGFSTTAQQADQSTRAAANADASRLNASTYLQNYLAERQNQNNAGGLLAQATGVPLSYLNQVSGAYTAPLSQAGNLISGLSSGGQIYTTGSKSWDAPSTGSNVMSGMGAL